MKLNDLRRKPRAELVQLAESIGIEFKDDIKNSELLASVAETLIESGTEITATGVLETATDGYGFLRSPENGYSVHANDIYVSAQRVKKFGLVTGDTIDCAVSPPRDNENYYSVKTVKLINSVQPANRKPAPRFDDLKPVYPDIRLKLESKSAGISTRLLDILTPIGKGQRALITSPPRTGKTQLLQAIAKAINENHPECRLMVLLIDERPEEVTDMERTVDGEVIASTFDESAARHAKATEMVLEKSKRLVESGADVVILMDSITRLGRAHNAVAPSSGKVLTGGVDSNALQKPKRFFGAARNIEGGGSLTIIATALIETGSRMDEVIFEEFKGTGNCEIVLSRKIADKRLYPAVDIMKSGTRREELMLSTDELKMTRVIRRVVSSMGAADALEFLKTKLESTGSNKEFFNELGSAK